MENLMRLYNEGSKNFGRCLSDSQRGAKMLNAGGSFSWRQLLSSLKLKLAAPSREASVPPFGSLGLLVPSLPLELFESLSSNQVLPFDQHISTRLQSLTWVLSCHLLCTH